MRMSAAVEIKGEILKNLHLGSRNLLEYRIYNKDINNVTRLRSRITLSYNIGKISRIKVFDELFFNLSGKDIQYFFNQNRLGAAVNFKVQSNMSLDLGYLRLTRLTSNHFQKVYENAILLSFAYQLVQRGEKSKNF